MNWQEIAGSVVNALRNAGVKKDIIDLQEKQVAIFRDDVAVLTRKLEVSESETADLKKKVADLQQQLERLRPQTSGLDETAVKFLQLLAQQPGLRIEQIAGYLSLSKVKAEYHRDNLMAAEMIGYHGAIVEIGDETYALRRKGREYLANHGHI
ncbi:MAG: hypothetical protein DME54_03685 [Verrucomicrobia bacterium]|nr:MAG: hypothetical protein DME75_11590 [Verrucomicrobiota bacterium]PYK35796.1 MAG: hypothetical protein DME54_03685 [Verrucomicrobiota bacterium]